MLALLDASETHHGALRQLFAANASGWILPAAVVPELDYLISAHLGARAQELFSADLADGAFTLDWGGDHDLARAGEIQHQYRSLQLGWVDSMVITCAERLRAAAIATLDLRHFGAVAILGHPRLLPRDSR